MGINILKHDIIKFYEIFNKTKIHVKYLVLLKTPNWSSMTFPFSHTYDVHLRRTLILRMVRNVSEN